ncbi:MAG TPA: inositol oxygenase family protein, partial [Urbifossiella sp.]
MNDRNQSQNPLQSLDDWENFVESRYPTPGEKAKEDYRNYDTPGRDTVRDFYQLNHRHQTYDFVRQKKADFLRFDKRRMTVLEALDFLDTLVDDSDPDIALSQREHLLQTSEAIRADGHPDWFVLVGLIHDLGKVLCLFGEPQWAVVGDTFPVGCAFSHLIVYPEFFADNPDRRDAKLQSPCGVYERGCGLSKVHLSWGHDEYLYHVLKNYLPEPALYMIR